MKVEIAERYSNERRCMIRVECENGDSLRIDIQEALQSDNTYLNRIEITSVELTPYIQPKASNQLLITFKD